MSSWRWLLIPFILLLAVGCQTPPPTKTVDDGPQPWTRLTDKTKKPLKLTEESVVLDARNDFDYGLAHWSYSIHLSWKDFVKDPQKPWEMGDAHTASRRLALLGIGPKTPVLVIGYGHKGSADDGRLAWTLTYFGVEDVQTVSIDGLDVYFTHQEASPPVNAPPWLATPNDFMTLNHNQFLQSVTQPGKVHVIDVRSKEEYFSRKGNQYDTPDFHALQIDWREFYREDGRPDKGIRSKLKDVGVKLDDTIIVISNHGIRSSAAAYALTALGFRHVQNFLEGWDSLRKPVGP